MTDLDTFARLAEAAAFRTPTPHLYHYTNADAALFGILASGTLRLSPLASTNDLWESQPTYHPLVLGHEAVPLNVPSRIMGLLDHHIRAHTKVACLTNDFVMSESFPGPRDALSGWSHLSLWAHYGAANTGVCLQFDRDTLVAELASSADANAQVFHGAVVYTSLPDGIVPGEFDIGQVREFGVDAVASALIKRHHRSIFFEKHQDWASENEYRLIRIDGSTLPVHLDIRSALTGVVLGASFADSRMAALRELLADYPNVELHQVWYLNRFMALRPPDSGRGASLTAEGPTDDSTTVQPDNWAGPRRPGTLNERVEALLTAEVVAEELLASAESASRALSELMRTDLEGLAHARRWAPANPSKDAIPAAMRSRGPGVRGEQVHFETGFKVDFGEPEQGGDVLVGSAALQVLEEGAIRLHAQVCRETVTPEGATHSVQLWRETCMTTLATAADIWRAGIYDPMRQALLRAEAGSA